MPATAANNRPKAKSIVETLHTSFGLECYLIMGCLKTTWDTKRHVFERIIKLMREKIRKKQYIMILHAEVEMNNDDFTIYDVESAILTGKIVERQRDRETAELKYRIN